MTLPVVSSSILSSYASQEFQPRFSPLPIHDTTYFDEGPLVTYTMAQCPCTGTGSNACMQSLSGSLSNLSSSYPYVQGVEITRQRQYDEGLVKIWSGEPGHLLAPGVFGQREVEYLNAPFIDIDTVDQSTFLNGQDVIFNTSPYYNVITAPVINDSNQLANIVPILNGIIEPLAVRNLQQFFSNAAVASDIAVPINVHTVRAGLTSGNDSIVYGSDRSLTVDYYDPTIPGTTPFIDAVGVFTDGAFTSGSSFVPNGVPLNGYKLQYDLTPMAPFTDARLVRNTIDPNDDDDQQLTAALALMTGSTANYVSYDQRSATCGWDYDSTLPIGTDSLAFGGMTY